MRPYNTSLGETADVSEQAAVVDPGYGQSRSIVMFSTLPSGPSPHFLISEEQTISRPPGERQQRDGAEGRGLALNAYASSFRYR